MEKLDSKIADLNNQIENTEADIAVLKNKANF